MEKLRKVKPRRGLLLPLLLEGLEQMAGAVHLSLMLADRPDAATRPTARLGAVTFVQTPGLRFAFQLLPTGDGILKHAHRGNGSSLLPATCGSQAQENGALHIVGHFCALG